MDLFDNEWMGKFKDVWNASEEVSGALAKIDFDSVIGCGFPDGDKPEYESVHKLQVFFMRF